jgi:hypothetical protein
MIRVAIKDHVFSLRGMTWSGEPEAIRNALQVLTNAVEVTGSTPDVEEKIVRELSARLPEIRELSRSKRPKGANLIY